MFRHLNPRKRKRLHKRSIIAAVKRALALRFRKRVPAVLFCTTNGVGMGHVTRALTLAKALREIDPTRPIVFLVSTPELSVVRRHGFPTYYVPYFAELKDDIGWGSWNHFVRSCALSILDNHRVEVVVFDGYIPFFGLVEALERRTKIDRIWVRRGLEKAGHTELPDRAELAFDYIIKPQEAGAEIPESDGRSIAVLPIVSFEPGTLPDRQSTRAELGIPAEAIVVYVQLGSGVKVDNSETLSDVLRVLNEDARLFVVLGVSILADSKVPPPRNGMVLRHYPNYLYLNAFDFVVSAAGYNAFHEALASRRPAIFIPRESSTDTEDQLARARIAERAGAAVVVRATPDRERFCASLRLAVERLAQDHERARFSAAAHKLLTTTGTYAAARFISTRRPFTGLSPTTTRASGSGYDNEKLRDLRRRMAHDEPELGFVGRLIEPGSVALDVGGDLGLYTVAMLDAGARVKIFECRADAAEHLRLLFAGFPVDVIEAAASNRSGAQAPLFVPVTSQRVLGSRASLCPGANRGLSQVQYPVRRCRIDDHEFRSVTLIKIDVEGHELAVLEGARRTLSRERPCLLVEIEERHHPGESDTVFAFLRELAYEGFYFRRGLLHRVKAFDFGAHQRSDLVKPPDGAKHPEYINNFLFLPKERERHLLRRAAVPLAPCDRRSPSDVRP